jgi:hypothetical protein
VFPLSFGSFSCEHSKQHKDLIFICSLCSVSLGRVHSRQHTDYPFLDLLAHRFSKAIFLLCSYFSFLCSQPNLTPFLILVLLPVLTFGLPFLEAVSPTWVFQSRCKSASPNFSCGASVKIITNRTAGCFHAHELCARRRTARAFSWLRSSFKMAFVV